MIGIFVASSFVVDCDLCEDVTTVAKVLALEGLFDDLVQRKRIYDLALQTKTFNDKLCETLRVWPVAVLILWGRA